MVNVPNSVTRIMIINTGGGVVQEFFADDWEIHVQDCGQTLKLRGNGDGHRAAIARSKALGEDLARGRKDQ